ncbi:MAG: DUF2723 domain-containing protein [Fibromonadales bacterium]|nr:DUF2723 domain-containing protein [Fibromonadales bacterium]
MRPRIALILLGIIGYALTMSRTVNFWDCGEFIAAANVLGFTHPPGYPLFVLLGRVFILLFGWISGPAFAVNLISVISSILCCLLIYEITLKISGRAKLGFFAASISLFGDTFWFNAVEAGSYAISMCIIMLEIWAALKWKETLERKYLFLILYAAFLGLGFHTFTLLPLPAIAIFVGWSWWRLGGAQQGQPSGAPLTIWGLVFIILGLSSQLYLPIRSSTEPVLNQNNPVTAENFLDVLSRKQYGDMYMFERALYRRAAPVSQFGFSENIGYLGYHLNQWFPAPYGAQAIKPFVHRIIFEFLIIAVFAGLWFYRKNLDVILVVLMFLLSSVGLVLYLNFSDGTKPESYNAKQWNAEIKELRKFVPNSIPDLPSIARINTSLNFYLALPVEMRDNWVKIAHEAEGLRTVFAWRDALNKQGKKMPPTPKIAHREVRDRDYFYTPAFLFFAIMAAIACRKANEKVAFALMFAWIIPFASHFSSHNRSKDYIARDFAMNVLNSVPQNGILITYGDNDTYPLWYMQLAKNYRTDVVVINETLFYSDWYKEQIFKNYQIEDIEDSERSISYSLGVTPVDDKPLVGLVRQLGIDQAKADSLLLVNLTENYRYGELKARGQEANEHTLMIYRYLARIALTKNPNEKQRKVLERLLETANRRR